jgi:hypothetical protein
VPVFGIFIQYRVLLVDNQAVLGYDPVLYLRLKHNLYPNNNAASL